MMESYFLYCLYVDSILVKCLINLLFLRLSNRKCRLLPAITLFTTGYLYQKYFYTQDLRH